MPPISASLSEIIKRRLFRAREHLLCLGPLSGAEAHLVENFATATYEYNQGLRLPSVKHLEGADAQTYREDAIRNLSTVIDIDLSQVEIPHSETVEQAVAAAGEMLRAIQTIPLPAQPSP